jgi:cob(I)alamin adenosyltransferase
VSIYTKKGDRGKTSLFGEIAKKPARVSKDSKVICAIGAIDELNSFLGVIMALSDKNKLLGKELTRIQENLLTTGSILAGSEPSFPRSEVMHLEKLIDALDKEVPPSKNFILPRGTLVASLLQYSRTLARRAEREAVALSKRQSVKSSILKYLNRLSDFLYTLSRWVNIKEGGKETIWNPR